MSDALSRLLDDVHPRGAVFDSSVMSAPWSAWCAEETAAVTVVALARGSAEITLTDGGAARLGTGDVAVVVGPSPYRIHDCDDSPAVLICGSYDLHGGVCDRVLGGLPTLLDVGGGLRDVVALLAAELDGDRAGRRAVVDRLLDLLLVSALREWLDRPGSGAPPWYRAQRDPVVGAALRLMHDHPAHPWSLAELARRGAVSRTAFARRFRDLVGEPPMSYLTCWRLCLARDLLRDTDDTLGTIAHKVGYANPYAFSAAFTRAHGVRPGRFRATA